MRQILCAVALMLSATASIGQSRQHKYTTSCQIKDGKAVGYIHSRKNINLNGKVHFRIFDKDYELIDQDWEIAVVVLVGPGTEFVEDTDVSAEAKHCRLIVKRALR